MLARTCPATIPATAVRCCCWFGTILLRNTTPAAGCYHAWVACCCLPLRALLLYHTCLPACRLPPSSLLISAAPVLRIPAVAWCCAIPATPALPSSSVAGTPTVLPHCLPFYLRVLSCLNFRRLSAGDGLCLPHTTTACPYPLPFDSDIHLQCLCTHFYTTPSLGLPHSFNFWPLQAFSFHLGPFCWVDTTHHLPVPIYHTTSSLPHLPINFTPTYHRPAYHPHCTTTFTPFATHTQLPPACLPPYFAWAATTTAPPFYLIPLPLCVVIWDLSAVPHYYTYHCLVCASADTIPPRVYLYIPLLLRLNLPRFLLDATTCMRAVPFDTHVRLPPRWLFLPGFIHPIPPHWFTTLTTTCTLCHCVAFPLLHHRRFHQFFLRNFLLSATTGGFCLLYSVLDTGFAHVPFCTPAAMHTARIPHHHHRSTVLAPAT